MPEGFFPCCLRRKLSGEAAIVMITALSLNFCRKQQEKKPSGTQGNPKHGCKKNQKYEILVEEIDGQRLISCLSPFQNLGVYIDYLFQTYFLRITDMKRKDQNKHLEFTVNVKATRAYLFPILNIACYPIRSPLIELKYSKFSPLGSLGVLLRVLDRGIRSV